MSSPRALVALLCAAAVAASSTGGYADENGGTTGGAGGTTVTAKTGKEIHAALCSRKSTSTPIIIYVEGTITLGNTAAVSGSSCSTASDRIELKGISNVSIIGKGKAIFDQIGIHIRNSKNIIIQNVHVRNVKKSNGATSNGGDAIGMEDNVSNVWVDHCTLEASGGESEGYDGLCDMKASTKYVTVSYTIFVGSGRGGLVGSDDSDTGNGPVTFHHNYYHNIDSRAPLLRAATAHAYNNYFDTITKSAMNPRNGAKLRAENNYFKKTKNPIGTFYTDKLGYWDLRGNVLDGCSWESADAETHPAGSAMKSTTTVNIPYSYKLDDGKCVPSLVLSIAGANTGIKVTTGSCSATSSGSSSSGSSSSGSSSTPTPAKTPSKTPTPPSSSSSSSCKTTLAQWGSCLDNVKCCPSGQHCYRSNQWYAQCRPSCDVSGWDCKKLG